MQSRRDSNEMSPTMNTTDVSNTSSDDESAPVQRTKKRVLQFSDNDSENEIIQPKENKTVQEEKLENDSDNEPGSSIVPFKSGKTLSRIQMGESSSDSEASSRNESLKNEEQQMRMKNKRNKLKDKFKGLLSSRGKLTTLQDNADKLSSEGSQGENSDASDNEISSISKIKQNIRKSMASMSSICDPDTSDEEAPMSKKEMPKKMPKKPQKSAKLIEAKPIRMSAKQAMENMQLIKSESNRMLREKAVSLPYHRPKALSLKDIMSRRKPAVALDGKVLPIKMNEDQLKHYVLLLEQRQKEMMELCKSESDEETPEAEEKNDVIQEEGKEVSESTSNKSEIIIEKTDNTAESIEDAVITNIDVAENDLAYTQLIENEASKTASTEGDNRNSKEVINEKPDSPSIATNDQQEDTEKDDSNTDFKLVYNDSVEEEHSITENTENGPKEDTIQEKAENNDNLENNSELQLKKVNSEPESQLISLHYSENNTEEIATLDKPNKPVELDENKRPEDSSKEITEIVDIAAEKDKQDDFFSDDDVNMEDIDRLIENAEILRDDVIVNSPMLIRDPLPLNAKPTLMGAPGMVIDLDGGSCVPKKTGVELLKERFTYFARLKTPEEIEREKEKRLKPGAQHLKLKHELEEKIAEQRSLEWAKRLEEEKQQHMEMETILDDAEDSFEKIEGKLEEEDEKEIESSSESEEEEPEENDIEIKDKPRKHNPMLDDEAEESDIEENEDEVPNNDEANEVVDDDNVEQADDEEEDSSENESSESEEEEEETSKPKKGRILKAFEDSDDEDALKKQGEKDNLVTESNKTNDVDAVVAVPNEVQSASQDDVIQLAQRHASVSDDLFTSQESFMAVKKTKEGTIASDEVMTQTFSILDCTSQVTMDDELKSPSKLNVLCISQPYKDPSLKGLVEGSQLPITQTSQSQPIGEDILALCTGKFYDNEFVSPTAGKEYVDDMSQDIVNNDTHDAQTAKPLANDNNHKELDETVPEKENEKVDKISKKADRHLLRDILDELDDPEFDKPKANKFFTGGNTQKQEGGQVLESAQLKKKFTIESDDDDEPAKIDGEPTIGKKKKLKKRKPEKRALQISDDEDEVDGEIEDDDDYISDLEDEAERLVEYDSEENEIEIKPDKPKKKRKVADFFEQEAELTSEDEWVGSGDEDEKGLDRMEREEGDDEVFHQGQLRKELGQIHMRDVLDQDKREVRIIQELLFEDGDLGDGHRQRKFRWRDAGEEDATGTVPDEFADTQEEEFESEEQWRKQRHEREVFLRTMQQDEEEAVNVSVNRTTIIKANLSSKSMSTLLQEVNQSKTEADSPVVPEKKTTKDIPSPKKSFSIFQQNYHGSLLTRGRGALARLAALATPLAADDDAPKIGSLASHKRNFVFTALTQDDDDVPKVTIKRKAAGNLGTPKLMKKMKIEEKLVRPRSGLLDHF